MSVPRPFGDTALDRVADAVPPDASSWYVVGAVVQVNAITRNELTTLGAESKKGGRILAGVNMLITWLPGFDRSALAGATCIAIVGFFLIVWFTRQESRRRQRDAAPDNRTRLPSLTGPDP